MPHLSGRQQAARGFMRSKRARRGRVSHSNSDMFGRGPYEPSHNYSDTLGGKAISLDLLRSRADDLLVQ